MKNKILTLILALSILIMCLPSAVSASVLGGTDGGNLTWMFDQSTGVFTVSGEGDMYPWTAPNEVTWRSHSTKIKKVIIEDGVTSISSYAFANGYQLEEVVIGDGVREIGENAFLNAKLLTSVTIPKSVELIQYRAFCSCPMLETLVLESTSASIYHYAFESTPINCIYYMGTEEEWDENNYSTLFYSAALHPLTVGGKAGDDIRYMLTFADESYESATLELVGTGDMYNWDDCENLAPWYKYRESIDTIIIDASISSIGSYAFYEHTNFDYINIPLCINYIGPGAFSHCHSLDTAVYSATQTKWNANVMVDIDNEYLLDALRFAEPIEPDTPIYPGVSGGGGGSADDIDHPNMLWIADAEASSGDEVTVYVKAGSDVLAALGSFIISYDTDVLTYKYHEFLGELSNLSTAANPNYQNTGRFYASFMNTQNVNLEGDILAITFEVGTHVPNNTSVPVMFDKVDFYYETEELSPVGFLNGNIWVLNYILGDVNNNGIIDLLDAFRVLKYDAGLLPAFTMSEEKAADANRDDVVNILDALLIQSHCAKLDTIY